MLSPCKTTVCLDRELCVPLSRECYIITIILLQCLTTCPRLLQRTSADMTLRTWTLSTLFWMQLSDTTTRPSSRVHSAGICYNGAMVELFLQPLVRSCQCRNAVRQQPTHHHDTLSKMEYCPLSEETKAVPNVLGIYLLHGMRTQGQDPVKDPRLFGSRCEYVNQCLRCCWHPALRRTALYLSQVIQMRS